MEEQILAASGGSRQGRRVLYLGFYVVCFCFIGCIQRDWDDVIERRDLRINGLRYKM